MLHGLVDTELHSDDFRASSDEHAAAIAAIAAVHSSTTLVDEKGGESDENESYMGETSEEEEEPKVEKVGRSSLIYQENGVLFNNRLSGSFVSVSFSLL